MRGLARSVVKKMRAEGRRLWGYPLIDAGDHRNSVFLAGVGRSGTTWVSEIINHQNEYRYMFEPFHPRNVSLCRGFCDQQYIRTDDANPYFLQTAEAILNGRVRDPWIDAFNHRRFSTKRLVKDVHCNLFLKWLHCHFPGMPLVFVMRHPCAVASSMLKHKWKWFREDFLAQPELVEDFLDPFRSTIERVHDPFERRIVLWCVSNYVLLRQFKPGEIFLLSYERLCVNPGPEIEALFRYLGKESCPSVLARLQRPSPLARKDSPIRTGESLVESWRKDVTSSQIARALNLLGEFDLHRVYSAESMPDMGEARRLLEAA